MIDKIRPLVKNIFGLSFQLAKAAFKQRNEGSFLGIFWYLLGPILTFILILAVFSARLGTGIPDYPLYLLIGLIMFNFFQFVTTESTRAVYSNRGIIKSIKFNLETIPVSTVMEGLFSHIFEIIIFGVAMFIYGGSVTCLLYYPLILLFFCLFVLGSSMILTSLAVYFTDLENIWIFFSKLLWFATPVFYDIAGQNKLLVLNLFNPIYYFITIGRDLVIYDKMPELWLVGGALAYSSVSMLVGIILFSILKKKFAEKI